MNLEQQISTKIVIHRNQKRVKLQYEYKAGNSIDKFVRSLKGARWSQTMRCWHIAYDENYLAIFKNKQILDEKKSKRQDILYAVVIIDKKNNKIELKLNDDTNIYKDLAKIKNGYRLKNHAKWFFKGTNNNYLSIIEIFKKNNYKYRKEIKKEIDEKQENTIVKHYVQTMIMRNNSKKTVEIYTPIFKNFVKAFENTDISKLEYDQINKYIQTQIYKKNYREEKQKQLISAIKYYYEKILGRPKLYFNLTNKEDTINSIIELDLKTTLDTTKNIKNTKDRLLVVFKYSYGLTFAQLSELSLSKSKYLINKQSNGLQRNQLVKIIKEYYCKYKPEKYFFEIKKNQYTEKNIRKHLFNIFEKNDLITLYRKEFLDICSILGHNEGTTKNYTSYFLTYLKNFKFAHPLSINNLQIRDFILKLSKKNYSKNTINSYINAIKTYYERTGRRELSFEYAVRPKREKKLPVVLSMSEIKEMLEKTKNIKHKTIIALLYSAGLRRGELINMKINDIDLQRNIILVKKGKGAKDRQTLLSQNLKKILKHYFHKYKPTQYVIEGATGGKYSGTSIERVIKAAAYKAKIEKNVSPHILRHSFATHLLEHSTDIRYIQELLGHNSIKTTQIYTHIANTKQQIIISPLDKITLSTEQKNEEKTPP